MPQLQMLQDFSYTMATSILPGGGSSRYSAIPGPDMMNYWNQPVLPQGLPRTGTSRYIDQPVQYMFDQIGSYGNRAGMILCQRDFNEVKGRVFNLNTQKGVNRGQAPWNVARFQEVVDRSLTNTTAQNEMIEALRQVIGVFRYINNNEARPILGGNIRNMEVAADQIAATVPPHLANIGVMFHEFYPAWYQEAARTARAWVADRINDIIARYTQAMVNGMAPPNAALVQMLVNQLFEDLSYIVSPYQLDYFRPAVVTTLIT
ncbi:hypothetical protein GGR55DRAFT_101306 [Xylaria sp. FL0064]|nr:hypothetical protein GGR55DRAFT_101306 [Xylaria sp. FL0064]